MKCPRKCFYDNYQCKIFDNFKQIIYRDKTKKENSFLFLCVYKFLFKVFKRNNFLK